MATTALPQSEAAKPRHGVRVKRFQHFVAQTAFAFLLLAIAVALAAGIGARSTLWSAAFGQFTNTSYPRTIQLYGKFVF